MSVARSRRIRAAPRIPAGLALVVPIVTLLTLLIYPLGLMAEQSIATPRGLSLAVTRNLLGSVMFRRALWHTIQIAGTATAICLVLGTTLALLLHITEMPGARAIGRLIDTYLAFPSFLIALALTFLYGNAGMITVLLQQVFGAAPNAASFLYGFWGVVLAEVTFYTPFVLRPLLAGLETLDPAQIEMASVLGASPFGVVRRVVLPAVLPSLLAGGSLCLLLTLNEFGILLVMGAKDVITLPLLIYSEAIQQFDYARASVAALCDIGLSLGLYALYRAALARLAR